MTYTSLSIQEPQTKYSAYETIILSVSPVFEFNPTPIHTLCLTLQRVSDPRRAQGTRHPLAIVLLLAILAICCGESSYEAMMDWAVNYQNRLESELPFLAGHTPSKSTFHRVFSALDAEELEKILSNWLQTITHLEKHEGIAIDGKAVKNTDLYLVSAFAHQAKATLFQQATTGKGKELVIAPQVLSQIDLTDKIVTGDALFTQRNLCKQITKDKGGYVFTVKDNQLTLREGIQSYFDDPFFRTAYGRRTCDIQTTTTLDAHKGRVEKRTYQVTDNADLLEYLNWPGLTHVFKCTRKVTDKKTGKPSMQIAYGIARLFYLHLDGQVDRQVDRKIKASDEVARILRGHWQIENNLHRKRDVVWNEDKSTIRTKSGPQVMSALTNLVTSIFHRGNVKSFPSANRRFRAQTQELFAFLGLYRQNQLALLPAQAGLQG